MVVSSKEAMRPAGTQALVHSRFMRTTMLARTTIPTAMMEEKVTN